MDENVEQSAKQAVAEYHKYKWISIGILVVLMIYSFFIGLKLDDRLSLVYGNLVAGLMKLSVLIVIILFAVVSVFVKEIGTRKIWAVLTKECDPFTYEACLHRLLFLSHKDSVMCTYALAQYYQGDFKRALDTLQRLNMYKLKGMQKFNYYSLMSSIYFKEGMGDRVAELEQAFRAGMKKREQKYFRILCASNNRARAILNKDYEAAFRFLQERKEAEGNAAVSKLTRVVYSLYEAQAYAGLGDKKSAKLNAQYVIENGGRLFFVEEAKKLLGTGGF